MRPSAALLTLLVLTAVASANPTYLAEAPPAFRLGPVANGSVFFESLDEVRGDVVVLAFVRTACSGSRAALPALERIREDNDRPDCHLLATTCDSRTLVRRFLYHHPVGRKIDLPIACGSAGDWGVRRLPWAYVIGRDGKVAWAGHPGRGCGRAVDRALAAPEPGMPEAPASCRKGLVHRQARHYAEALRAAESAMDRAGSARFGKWLAEKVRSDFDRTLSPVIARLAEGDTYTAYESLRTARERFRDTPHELALLARLDALARDEKARDACSSWKLLWQVAAEAREEPEAITSARCAKLRTLSKGGDERLAEAALELVHVLQTPWNAEDAARVENLFR